MTDKKKIYLILIGLCFLVFANSLNGDFVSDDIPAIIKNPAISNPGNHLFNPGDLLSSLTYLLVKDNSFLYHLTNVILHSLNTILVFLFLTLFFKDETSFLGASLFAVHPIHVEAVSWISGRIYLVSALFTFGTYLLYRRSSYFGKSAGGVKVHYYLLGLFIFSYFIIKQFSFYSLTPLLFMLSDITFKRWRKNWKLWLPFLGVAGLRLALAKSSLFGRIDSVAREMGSGITWNNPVFNLAYSFFAHLGLLIWPDKLTLYHEPAQISSWFLTLELIILTMLALALPFIYKKAKPLFFALGIFVLFLAPTYSPVLISWLVAERYAYIPSIALSLGLGFAYEKHAQESKLTRNIARALFILIIAIYSLRTVIRNEDWKTPQRLWQATVKVSPLSPRAHNNMGDVYCRGGRIELAVAEFKKAIELNPNYADACHNLANTYQSQGNFQEAIVYYQKAISFNPLLFESYYNLGIIYLDSGEWDKAIEKLDKAVQLRPQDKNAHYALEFAVRNKR